jgi:hypothetical protein
MPTKNSFFKFFCILLFEGTFTSVFKDKSKKGQNSRKYKSRFFLLFCMLIRIRTNNDGSGWPPKKTYGSYGSGSTTLVSSHHDAVL